MIESPPDNIDFEPLATDEDNDPANKTLNPDRQPTKGTPITASFRSTIRHLHQERGNFRARFAACFRGVWISIVNEIIVSWIVLMLTRIPYLPRGVATVFAVVICAQLSLTWTHIVISEPSPKPWFRRIPSAKTWKKVAVPTAILAIAQQISIIIPISIAMMCGMDKHIQGNGVPNMNRREASVFVSQSFGLTVLAIVLSFLLVFPAEVSLTRVQASLLPDSEETIVPFDRTFNGKVIPEIVGGSGVIGTLDAWRTFDWGSRVRLVKTYLKVILMQVALGFVFVLLVVGELALTSWIGGRRESVSTELM